MFRKLFPLIVVMLLVPTLVSAQYDDACPALVQSAYDETQAVCEALGNDEACYGNQNITAAPDSLAFSTPGDLAALDEIDSLLLSSMNVEEAIWGISLINVAALVDGFDAPQVVQLVLFGNVEIANAAEEDSGFAPMQAFTFTSGVEDRPCDEAPDSGIMIQTPQGVGEITLLVNEVAIDLGSTAFLQAEPGNEMAIHIVDGSGDVSTGGASMTVPEGAWARVPLDEDGLPNGPAEGPLPYNDDELATLPINLLTEEIVIAPAIEEGVTQGAGLTPIAGDWTYTDCDGSVGPISISFQEDIMHWDDGESQGAFARLESGAYQMTVVDGQDISEFDIIIEFAEVSEDFMESTTFGFDEALCTIEFTR